MTTFDRYLLWRFLHVFGILFMTTYGLYVVIDGFTNIDDFQEGKDQAFDVLMRMVEYYGYHSSIFFDMSASILSVVSAMAVFALLLRHSEIHPLLAAGIPAYRLAIPTVVGTLLVSGMLAVNQEWIVPRISHQLQSSRGASDTKVQKVEQVNDYDSGIVIGGKQLQPKPRRVIEPRFVLPFPNITEKLTMLEGSEAVFWNATEKRPSGWLVKRASPSYEKLKLTDDGRKRVVATNRPGDIFIVTDVSFDQLSSRSQSYKYVSTAALLRRIRNPAFSIITVRAQTMNFHFRLLRPLLDVTAVLIAIPLIVRKESRSIVGNMAICTGVLGVVYGLTQATFYLGSINIVSMDLASWMPVIFCGSLSAWLSGIIQT